MAIKFISADERLASRSKVNIAIFSPSGVGKTFQARTLDPETTLFVDLEAGTLALGDWAGTTIDVRKEAQKLGIHPWEFCRALACLLSGPDPAASTRQESPSFHYSQQMFDAYQQVIAPRAAFDRFTTIFWDSITVAARHSFAWSQGQPAALSDKGKYDGRGVYGLHGQEVVTWLTQIQHTPDKSTVVVGILNESLDDFKRVIYEPQIDGSKAGRELPGIFDEVLTLGLFTVDPTTNAATFDLQKGTQRAFICRKDNGYGVPAKDRSGSLDALEPPDLGALMAKIAVGKRTDTPVTTIATTQAA